MSEGPTSYRSAQVFGVTYGYLTEALRVSDEVVHTEDPPPAGARVAFLNDDLALEMCVVEVLPGDERGRRLIRGQEGTRAKEWPIGTEWRVAGGTS